MGVNRTADKCPSSSKEVKKKRARFFLSVPFCSVEEAYHRLHGAGYIVEGKQLY